MGDHLENVRAKLEEFTEHIEKADEQIINHKNDTLEAIQRYEKLEVELQTAKRRIVLIQEDLKVATARLAVQEEKLATTQSSSEETEKERDELEAKEGDMEENVTNLENSIKETKDTAEKNAGRLVESERREDVCKAEIARLQEKAEKDEARVKTLEETIEGYGQRLAEVEEREGEAGEREALSEEKIAFLERELKETTVRAEAAERMSAVLNNTNFDLGIEVEKWVKGREDMMSSMTVMDDVADDPAYKCFDVGGDDDESGRTTPASIFGAKSEKKFAKDDGSRSASRAGTATPAEEPREPTPEPTPAPPAPAPAPAPEEESEEEEDSDDGW